jgi:hypothetical protein
MSSNSPIPPTRWSPRRTLGRFILAAGLLAAALLGLLRFQQALSNWVILESIGVQPGPGYMAGTGLLWGGLGIAGALAAWVGWPRSGAWVRGSAAGLALSYWLDRLLFTQSPAAQANWLFALIVTLTALTFVLGVSLMMDREEGFYRNAGN